MKNKKALSALLGGFLAQASPPNQGVFNEFFRNQVGTLFGGSAGSPAKAASIGALILATIKVLLLVAASVAVVFLMVGGYRYVVAHGNEEATEAAKKTMTGAIVGLAVIILSFAIINLVSRILLEGPPGTGI